MRIALIHNFYQSANPSGENSVVRWQHETLSRAGFDVVLIERTSDDIQRNTARKIKAAVDVAFDRGISPLEDLRTFRPDIVHVHNLFPAFRQRSLAAWHGAVVTTAHNFRSVCANGLMFRDGHSCQECVVAGSQRAVAHRCYRNSRVKTIPLALATRGGVQSNHLLQRSDTVIVLSEVARARFELLGLQPEKIRVVPNGFSAPDASPIVPNGSGPWLFVGRLSPEKGILNLLREWPHNEPLEIVGDGPLRDTVEALTGNLPHAHLSGGLQRSEVLELMQSSKGLVFPSTCFEMQPTVLAEAASMALPVVCSERNSSARLVAENNLGVVYGSSRPLTAALATLINGWEEFSINSLMYYQRELSERAWLNAIVHVYETAIKQGRISD